MVNLTVDNAGSPLSAPEIILVANRDLTLATGAEVTSEGSLGGGGDLLLLGDSNVSGSGDGLLLRVTSAPGAQIARTGLSASTLPTMTIGAGATISGAGVTLDSSYAMNLSPFANLVGSSFYLDAGQISLQLNNPGGLLPTNGLVLAGSALSDLESARSLSLLSYSSIDIYGTGDFSTNGLLALHAAEIRGFNNGGQSVVFSAPTILLDNSPGRTGPGAAPGLQGTLEFDAGSIELGMNTLAINNYANVVLNADKSVLLHGSGQIAAQSNLSIITPYLAALDQATQTV